MAYASVPGEGKRVGEEITHSQWSVIMFDEYIGMHLKQRHKYIGLKYAEQHHFPELISPISYGICFKQEGSLFLIFRVFFESKPLYDTRGRNIPGRSIKTITEIVLFGEGYTQEEMEEAIRISRGYLELATEE